MTNRFSFIGEAILFSSFMYFLLIALTDLQGTIGTPIILTSFRSNKDPFVYIGIIGILIGIYIFGNTRIQNTPNTR